MEREKKIRRYFEEDSIPIYPMIDMVFILLIFIMVSVHFDRPLKALPVSLPSERGGEGERADLMRIGIDLSGGIYFEGRRIDLAELERIAGSDRFREKKVLLSVDRRVPFGLFVTISMILERADSKEVLIEVEEGRGRR